MSLRSLSRYDVSVEELVGRFKKAHRPISEYFHAGIWGEMQNVDSQIALDVMTRLISKRLPCLPRHDSFITQQLHADKLELAMREAYRESTKRVFKKPSSIEISTKLRGFQLVS